MNKDNEISPVEHDVEAGEQAAATGGAWVWLLVVLICVLFGLSPVLLYGLFFGRVPTVSALEARQLLSAPGSQAILVDVRTPEEFRAGHLERAENWPLESIVALSSPEGVPQRFEGKPLLLICEGGIYSAWAARKLQALSVEASHIHGGMQAWVSTALKSDGPAFSRLQTAPGEITSLPHREIPGHEQVAAVTAAFVIKPLYMLLSLLLIIVLSGSRSPDLLVLLSGLLFFLIGETFCAANIVYSFARSQQSDLLEYLHGLGMVLCMGFVAFALLDGVDRRIVRYSDPRSKCAALGLCRACIKYTDAPCGLKRSFILVSLILAILAFMPLCALPHIVSYNTTIFRLPYNYAHPAILQLFEIRYCPVVAIGLLTVSFLISMLKKNNQALLAKIFLAAGLGALAFSLLRLVLLTMYRDTMVWFVFWEEATELLFVIGVGFILWVFRRGLFRDR